ncbi:autotransporter outer membrane beta-barrel domain-containing protein [Microbulbifer sp. OS29]|uniref:Autotransporter outer membrane beta-barrel domain-containing protein n=1 Tax=Microbulbifer okhotskensis TaxID=2926617 RepID=A0A9X2J6I2_9GAMM|nr:autotransporter outer membrane beta-barrel domain-containing protein [Microbulbifer okhotskensis]MCO1335444.1 autotransporter outer membrane beta-barrel domain-containing protein [Microbulbifer okhotskensis]
MRVKLHLSLLIAMGLVSISFGSSADCDPGNNGTAAADQITCSEDYDPNGEDINLFAGNDSVTLSGGTAENIYGGEGDDQIIISGGVINQLVDGGEGSDTITLDDRSSDVGNYLYGGGIHGGAGDDTLILLDGLSFHVWGGDGNDSITLDGGFVFNYLDAGDGDDYIYWDEGISNEIRGGLGSDTLIIDSHSFDGDAILNGGDDLSSEDGDIDSLIFKLDYTVDGSLLNNWERIVVWGSSKMILTGNLAVGGGLDTEGVPLGLDIRWGGQVFFDADSFIISGDVSNNGTIDLANNKFNTLTITKDDSGNHGHYRSDAGRLWMDVVLSDDLADSDQLIVKGGSSGTTTISIFNQSGTGARTQGNGIKLVSIEGDSTARFTLNGDYVTKDEQQAVIGGAYAYTLHKNGTAANNDGDWYLRSVVDNSSRFSEGGMIRWQPAAVSYESLPQILRSLNIPTSLRSRLGNRYWVATDYRDENSREYREAYEQTIDNQGLWIRDSVRHITLQPNESTTRASWNQTYYQIQLGFDLPIGVSVFGSQLIGSAALHYGDSNNDISSFFGDGSIDASNYGVSGFVTWYGPEGVYIDSQLKLSWFDFDMDTSALRSLNNSNEALGYALSVEGGKSYRLHNYYSVTPHAQLIYTSEEANNLIDIYDVQATDINNNGFMLRLGSIFEKRKSQRKNRRQMYGSVPLERFSLFVTPSLIYNIDQKTNLLISGTRLTQEPDTWYAELRLGASYDECGDHCSIYSEIHYSSSLENLGGSFAGGLELGFRYKW